MVSLGLWMRGKWTQGLLLVATEIGVGGAYFWLSYKWLYDVQREIYKICSKVVQLQKDASFKICLINMFSHIEPIKLSLKNLKSKLYFIP